MRWEFGGAGDGITRFFEDRRGNFAIITAGICMMLFLCVGLGIDTAQMVLTRSNLLNALDSAVTSTARDLTTGNIPGDGADREQESRKMVLAYLKANGGSGFAAADDVTLDSLHIDPATSTVRATASVNIGLVFPVFGAANNQKITVDAAALYSDKKIEVAMMLDLTTSMAANRRSDKIGDLRKAATNAVTTMLDGQNPANPRIRVALVPYASGVNVGDLVSNIYAESSSSSDLPPVAGSPLLVSATGGGSLPSYAEYKSIVASAYPPRDTCATERKDRYGNADSSADGPDTIRTDQNGKQYYAMVNRDNNLEGSGMNKCPDAKIIPLTTDKDALLASIDDFKANGFTAGAIAVQWTYYMLSPQWRSAIEDADLGDGPANSNPDKISKVAILMTDGQFNTAYAGVRSGFNGQDSLSRGNAESICSNMKHDEIEVYTIGFALPSDEASSARGVLENCASPDRPGVKHFFDVSTGPELDQAFQEIIANTERLVLTQ